MNEAISTPSPAYIDRLIEGFQSDCRIRGIAKGSVPRYLSVIGLKQLDR